jgi:glycosyltransferase involved in cell wall biosynthesis
MRSPLLTLVVATVRRVAEVGRLLESLASQTNDALEVILVDQNQDNRLEPIVRSAKNRGMNISHIRIATPNQYLARTVGIENGNGPYVAFPDDDCWYESNTVEEVLRAFESTGADCVIARWLDKNSMIELTPRVLDWREVQGFRSPGPSMITQFYKSSAIDAIGGFDNRIGLGRWFGGGEDTDVFFSVLRRGMTAVFVPDVVVRHNFEPSTRSAGNYWRLRSRARGTGALYAKHRIPVWVVFRGIVAPLVKPLFPLRTGIALRAGWEVSVGRLEGYLKWKFGEKS